jgi:membrane protein implicated in regulation of membrane protease activity
MIRDFAVSLGPWNWWILALILIGIEILAPGSFFLWFGISAFVIGTITLTLGPDNPLWGWQTQVVAFIVLSLASAIVGRRFLGRNGPEGPDPADLNDRAAQLIGRVGVVLEPIAGGHGRIRVGDTTWRVEGPDLPSGARVKVIDQRPGVLIVEKA